MFASDESREFVSSLASSNDTLFALDSIPDKDICSGACENLGHFVVGVLAGDHS